MRINQDRYVRTYWSRTGNPPRKRWALWDYVDGKARRVGTADTPADYQQFLYCGDIPDTKSRARHAAAEFPLTKGEKS